MKNAMKLIGLIALTAVITFTTACKDSDSDAGDKGGGSVKKYTGVDGSLNVYELEFNSASQKEGDDYTLTITPRSGSVKKSSGTISSISGSTFTLSSGTAFTVTTSGSAMTAMSGTINLDGGGTQAAPALKAVTEGGDGSLNGTWKYEGQTVKFNGKSFTYTGDGITAPGTAFYGADVLVTTGNYNGKAWIVAGNYTLTPGVKIKFADFTGMLSEYSGDWLKN